jgi:hypothetical protein
LASSAHILCKSECVTDQTTFLLKKQSLQELASALGLTIDRIRYATDWHLGITLEVCMSG